jgi:formyltetrahydrofolate-dependent phosphoribosylglycinamide formyltransferase
MNKARLAVLISGNGSNLQAILDAIRNQQINARIVTVISNRPEAYGLQRAAQAGLPNHAHELAPYLKGGRTRRDYDHDLAMLLRPYQPDWVILAGWMHILSSAFLEHYPHRVLNLHPALPGMFPGTNAIERAFDAYQKGEIEHTGVMIHHVPDETVDAGPVVASVEVPIYEDDTLDTLESRVHRAEHDLMITTLLGLVGEPKPSPRHRGTQAH